MVQLANQFQPVHAWKLHVGDDHLKITLLCFSQASISARFNDNLMTFFNQHAPQRHHNPGIVFD